MSEFGFGFMSCAIFFLCAIGLFIVVRMFALHAGQKPCAPIPKQKTTNVERNIRQLKAVESLAAPVLAEYVRDAINVIESLNNEVSELRSRS